MAKPKHGKASGTKPRRTTPRVRPLIPIIGGFLIALAGSAAFGAYFMFRPLRATLIGLDAAERAAVERIAAEAKVAMVLSERPAGELGRALASFVSDDLVFAKAGLELQRARMALVPIPAEIHGRVPQSILWGASPRDGIRALPLLVDHFEVAWRWERWDQRGLDDPLSRGGFDRGAAAFVGKTIVPLLFAGGDDETLLQALSALCLSLSGAEGYRQAARTIAENPARAVDALEGSGPLAEAVAELRRWRKSGYMHPEWDKIAPADVLMYMERGMANLVLQSLSFHRTVPYRTIFDYRSGPFPPYAQAGRSAIVSPLTVVAVPARGWRVKAALRLVERFSRPSSGPLLAEASGRASALSASRAPDIQAADALAWAAGRRSVVSGLYRDAFADPSRAAAFARAVREAVWR